VIVKVPPHPFSKEGEMDYVDFREIGKLVSKIGSLWSIFGRN
jgi:hypothetical protein